MMRHIPGLEARVVAVSGARHIQTQIYPQYILRRPVRLSRHVLMLCLICAVGVEGRNRPRLVCCYMAAGSGGALCGTWVDLLLYRTSNARVASVRGTITVQLFMIDREVRHT
jgi:hypothetical protein